MSISSDSDDDNDVGHVENVASRLVDLLNKMAVDSSINIDTRKQLMKMIPCFFLCVLFKLINFSNNIWTNLYFICYEQKY
jgi:hypothetical protein